MGLTFGFGWVGMGEVYWGGFGRGSGKKEEEDEKEEGKEGVNYDDIDYLKITYRRLYERLQEYDQNNINEFIEYLNKEIFHHIQGEVKKAKDMEAWDENNMWYGPNRRFDRFCRR